MADDTLRHSIETGVNYQNPSGAMVVWSAAVGAEDDAFVLRADRTPAAVRPRASRRKAELVRATRSEDSVGTMQSWLTFPRPSAALS
jgi:hypothetical protein